jgi:opacity protein-like surface antigen
LKKSILVFTLIAVLLAIPTLASATDVVFGLSYRPFTPAGEAFDINSNFKANLGLKLDISKVFEANMGLKIGIVRADMLDASSAKIFGVSGELSALFSLLNWKASDDFTLKIGPMAGINFANGQAYAPDGSIDLFLGGFTRFDFLESFRIDARAGYGFMSKGLVAGGGVEYAFTPNWFIRADFDYMRQNGFVSISGGYRF